MSIGLLELAQLLFVLLMLPLTAADANARLDLLCIILYSIVRGPVGESKGEAKHDRRAGEPG